jgi:uncharacterized protein YaiE (UPF0345 family)
MGLFSNEMLAVMKSIKASSATLASPTYRATGFEPLTVTNAAVVTLTASTYGTATKAIITVADGSIRVRWDGTAPTTTVGHLCDIGTTIELLGHDLTHFQAIAVGVDAIITVTYSTEV